MTVAELMAELSKWDSDLEVTLECSGPLSFNRGPSYYTGPLRHVLPDNTTGKTVILTNEDL